MTARRLTHVTPVADVGMISEADQKAGQHTITAADPLPDELRQALNAVNRTSEGVR